jgi:ribosome-binding factor A
MSTKGWSRVDRVNEALREVVAEELALIDDERLQLVTITGVRVDPDFRRALVWFSALSGLSAADPTDVVAVLGEHRVGLQKAVGRQLRLKRTPELTFQPDPAIAVGTRVEEVIRGLQSQEGTQHDQADRPGAGG